MLSVIANDLPRFMACNGSRSMAVNPVVNEDNTVRDEGNAVDWLIQQVFRGRNTLDQLVDRKAFNGVYITQEMIEHVTPYLDAIQSNNTSDIELETTMNGQTWQVRGRADNIAVDNDLLHIRDFKYGWGLVEVFENWTLIFHAIGYLAQLHPSIAMCIKRVRFTIYQPRPHHYAGRVREWEIDKQELINEYWPRLLKALENPDDKVNTSPNCYKCPSMATCPAHQKACMNALEASERAFDANIDNEGLTFFLDHTKRGLEILTQAHKAYSEMALHRLKEGQIVQGYGLENELSNRQWKDGINVETMQMLTGKNLGKPQLITPNQAVKAGLTEDIVNSLCERVSKGSKLVKMDANAKAKKLFKK